MATYNGPTQNNNAWKVRLEVDIRSDIDNYYFDVTASMVVTRSASTGRSFSLTLSCTDCPNVTGSLPQATRRASSTSEAVYEITTTTFTVPRDSTTKAIIITGTLRATSGSSPGTSTVATEEQDIEPNNKFFYAKSGGIVKPAIGVAKHSGQIKYIKKAYVKQNGSWRRVRGQY